MNINSLPDLCLRHIFAHLPLLDLLRLGAICSRWHLLQPSVLNTKTTLTLLLGEDTFQLNTGFQQLNACQMENVFLSDHLLENQVELDCSLQFSELQLKSGDIVDHLYDAFPNVQCLSVISSSSSEVTISSITRLIQRWAVNLRVLNLWLWTGAHGYRFHSTSVSQSTSSELEYCERLFLPCCADKLLSVINLNLPKLSHLILNLGNYMSPLMDLSILNQLESFYFNSAGTFANVLKQLIDYGGDRLREIGVGRWIDYQNYAEAHDSLERVMQSDLTKKFHYLRVDYTPHVEPAILFEYFNRLTVLHLHLHRHEGHFSLASLARTLQPLSRLRHLRLNAKHSLGRPLWSDDHLPSYELPQLVAIRILTLDVCVDHTHVDLHSKHWSWLFPNVHLLRVHHILVNCGQCQWAQECDGLAPKELKADCLRRLLDTFRGFPLKCRLLTNRLPVMSVEEL